jgi:hypothetical protein
MEDGSLLAMGTNWEWQVPVGVGDAPGGIHEMFEHQVVVWIHGPGYSYHRRFQTFEGDAVQFHIKSFRPLPPVIGNEGWTSPMSIQEIDRNIPVLTRSNATAFRMGRNGARESAQEENRSRDSIPPDGDLIPLDSLRAEKWFDELLDNFN